MYHSFEHHFEPTADIQNMEDIAFREQKNVHTKDIMKQNNNMHVDHFRSVANMQQRPLV